MDLREFFESEAEESLAALREAADEEAPTVGAVRRGTRVLRGSSLLARDDRVHAVATALSASLADETTVTAADFRARLAATVADLEALIAREESESSLKARAHAAADRWGGARGPQAAEVSTDGGGAEAFVAREVAAIADTMDEAVIAFQTTPADHDWLAAVLRRQRALLGSVHIDNMPLVGEALRAVEDLTGVIYRLDVPVKAEWLDIYRAGRDVLRSAHDALVRGEQPGPVPALSRLRTLHAELMSRYADRSGPGAGPVAEDAGIVVDQETPPASETGASADADQAEPGT